jgi:hypothetical protein
MRMKPGGSTCWKKRRRNSCSSSVQVLFGGAVGVAEADLSVPMPEDATLADSRLVNVTCEVSQGHTRVAHGLELHRPGLPPNLFWN